MTSGQCRRSWSRYLCFSAEQLITPPSLQRTPSHCPIASSHGNRSSSFNGLPDVIFWMFVGGWKSSASANGMRMRCANAAPTVDLPEPETPITTIGDRIHTTYPFVPDVTQPALIVIRLQAG